MKHLIPALTDAALSVRGEDFLPRLPRRVQRAIDQEIAIGMIRASRAQADAYVAEVRVEGAASVARLGMQRVAELSTDEARYTARTPQAAARCGAIADTYAGVVVSELAKLERDW